MRVLHTAALPRLSSGIVQQMSWEQEAARRLDINWDVRIFTSPPVQSQDPMIVYCQGQRVLDQGNLLSRILARMAFSRAYFHWLGSIAEGYDLILLRHNLYSFDQLWFIIKYRKKVLTVHHTLEIPELRTGSKLLRSEFFSLLESVIGRISISLLNGFLGVTQEIVNYEQSRVIGKKKKTLVYPNGILYEQSESTAPKFRPKSEVPELLFVASSFAGWQGLDLLLEAVNRTSSDFVLHLVGDIVAEDDIRIASADSRIIVHGRLSREAISELAERSSIGLASFGLHRVTMAEACTLKVREYLYNGLPVYSGHKDIFPASFPYYRCGPVDIDHILGYATEMEAIDRRLIVSEAEAYISKSLLINELYGKLHTWV